MKKYNYLLLTVFLLFGCGSSGENKIVEQNASPYDFVLLHYNDLHAHNIPWVPVKANPDNIEVGGYAILDAMMDSVENIYPIALRFSAGDDFQGTPVSAMTKGFSQLELIDAAEIDFMTIGNHEFDYGWKNIEKSLSKLDLNIYAANLIDKKSGKTPLKSYEIFEFSGKKMAVIGLITTELKNLTLSKNIEGLEVLDPAVKTREIIKKLKKDGIEFFVAVTHQGMKRDLALAEAVPELDLIIGGHSHTYVPREKMIGKTRVVQTGSYGRNLGIIKLKIEQGDISLFDYMLQEVRPSETQASEDIQKIVDKYEGLVGAELNEVIGVLKQDWDKSGLISNIGIWQCDAMMEACAADIAFQNNGGIRKNLKAGEIRIRDIWEIAPFGNTLVTFEVLGAQLTEMIDYMVQSYRFRSLQSSGIILEVDVASQKILKLNVGGKAIDPTRMYRMVTNNYVADNMKKNFGLESMEVINTGLLDRDVFIEAVKKQKFIDSQVDDRVQFIQ